VETSDSNCPICSSASIRRKPFKYVFHGSELHGWSCGQCRLIFIHPQPTAEELKQLYSAEYFEGGDFRCGHEEAYSDPETLKKVSDPGLLIEIKGLTSGRRFLEIGCAGGAFLDAARKVGFQVQGVELSDDACRFARETFGLQVFAGELADAHFPEGSFDVVFMGDVIEHLADPVAVLREINRVLDKQGMLVMALPSQTNSLFSRLGFLVYGLAGRSATVSLPPYHLFEYRTRSLRYVLRMCGFEISVLRQGIIPPSRVNLRGPAIQRFGKKLLQYPNFVLTHLFGVCGDRITVFAVTRK
jgi:2-polyprenyl-3-methyl-5-hydroxy-6-metoxy-1,4-benzoquinol methylase